MEGDEHMQLSMPEKETSRLYLRGMEEADACDIYECCKQRKKLKHCGHCHELPCILYEAQDPTKSEADNQKDFLTQMKNLTEAQ